MIDPVADPPDRVAWSSSEITSPTSWSVSSPIFPGKSSSATKQALWATPSHPEMGETRHPYGPWLPWRTFARKRHRRSQPLKRQNRQPHRPVMRHGSLLVVPRHHGHRSSRKEGRILLVIDKGLASHRAGLPPVLQSGLQPHRMALAAPQEPPPAGFITKEGHAIEKKIFQAIRSLLQTRNHPLRLPHPLRITAIHSGKRSRFRFLTRTARDSFSVYWHCQISLKIRHLRLRKGRSHDQEKATTCKF